MRGYPKQDEVRKISRLWTYPVILLFCYGPATVRRVWEQVGSPPYWLAVLHICFSSLHGTLNALAYGRNQDVRMLNSSLLDYSFGSCMGLRKMDKAGISFEVWISNCPTEVSRIVTENEKSHSAAKEVLSTKALTTSELSPDQPSLKVEMVASCDADEGFPGAD